MLVMYYLSPLYAAVVNSLLMFHIYKAFQNYLFMVKASFRLNIDVILFKLFYICMLSKKGS